MKSLLLAALLLATFTVEADAARFRQPLLGRSWNKTTNKQVIRSAPSRCRMVNGVRVCNAR